MKRFFLDARELEHPAPLEKSIDILKQLDNNSYYYMIHRKEPIPLLALAQEHNLNYISKEQNKQWHIIISPNPNINLEELLKEKIENV
ncbi:MAG: hypothetical protein GXN91_00930 [Epsilonproteobacteria bacterium]|nr:hypothetical protein [Campylobacterota bacterium]